MNEKPQIQCKIIDADKMAEEMNGTIVKECTTNYLGIVPKKIGEDGEVEKYMVIYIIIENRPQPQAIPLNPNQLNQIMKGLGRPQ